MENVFSVSIGNKIDYSYPPAYEIGLELPTTKELVKESLEELDIKEEWQLDVLSIDESEVWDVEYGEYITVDLDNLIEGIDTNNLDLNMLNYYASLLKGMGIDNREKMAAIIEAFKVKGLKSRIVIALNLDNYVFYGRSIHDDSELGRMFLENANFPAELEEWFPYIDIEKYGKDVRTKNDGKHTKYGYVERKKNTFDYSFMDIPEEYAVWKFEK